MDPFCLVHGNKITSLEAFREFDGMSILRCSLLQASPVKIEATTPSHTVSKESMWSSNVTCKKPHLILSNWCYNISVFPNKCHVFLIHAGQQKSAPFDSGSAGPVEVKYQGHVRGYIHQTLPTQATIMPSSLPELWTTTRDGKESRGGGVAYERNFSHCELILFWLVFEKKSFKSCRFSLFQSLENCKCSWISRQPRGRSELLGDHVPDTAKPELFCRQHKS